MQYFLFVLALLALLAGLATCGVSQILIGMLLIVCSCILLIGSAIVDAIKSQFSRLHMESLKKYIPEAKSNPLRKVQ